MNIPIIFIRPWHAESEILCLIINDTQIDMMIVHETEDSPLWGDKKRRAAIHNRRMQNPSCIFPIIIGLLVGIGVPFFGKHVFFPIINACNDTASVRS